MTIFQAFILGLVQGLTEFLPISSSGHLIVAQKLLNFSEPPITFDILIHFGSLLAIVVFFWASLKKMFHEVISFRISPFVWAIIIGTLPALIFGVFIDPYISGLFNSLTFTGITWLINAALLFSVRHYSEKGKTGEKISWLDALIVGTFQALAILPAISRSGATVVSGLWRGLNRETAFTYSFLLGIPAILGAFVFKFKDLSQVNNADMTGYLVGFLVSAFVSYFAIIMLKFVMRTQKLHYFGFYSLLAGITTLIWL